MDVWMWGNTYFHFPPLFLSLLVSRPMYVAMPRLALINYRCSHAWAGGLRTHCTPKSPVLNTSILFNPKHANISTLHLPRPRTATSFSINSSSLALTSICAVSSPLANFSASPEMYSALRWDKPAVRRVGRSFAMTCVGEGKAGCVSSKRAVNFLRMEAAAWPETY
jgi:hypothetical protein